MIYTEYRRPTPQVDLSEVFRERRHGTVAPSKSKTRQLWDKHSPVFVIIGSGLLAYFVVFYSGLRIARYLKS
jgi:hypothetical protein